MVIVVSSTASDRSELKIIGRAVMHMIVTSAKAMIFG